MWLDSWFAVSSSCIRLKNSGTSGRCDGRCRSKAARRGGTVGIKLPQALHIATLLEKPEGPLASYTLPFEKGPPVTTLGHLTIYRYQPKASQSEVRAVWAFCCKVALDYSARRRSAILMP